MHISAITSVFHPVVMQYALVCLGIGVLYLAVGFFLLDSFNSRIAMRVKLLGIAWMVLGTLMIGFTRPFLQVLIDHGLAGIPVLN